MLERNNQNLMKSHKLAEEESYSNIANLNESEITYQIRMFNEYLESVYNYLIGRNFKYLGTRGEVIYAEGEAKQYAFLPHDKGVYGGYRTFSSNETPDDYYFVFSNSIKNEETGEIECCIVHIKAFDRSEAVINGKKYDYNVEMSVYRESVSEGYKFPTYSIEYVENVWHVDLADQILPNQPTFSLPGKEVTVRIKPQSEDIELWIDGGKQIQRTAVTDEYWEYTFTMPENNIKLLLHPKGLH